MVNFKASGHQGEHKRALASQADAHARGGVSKLEKTALQRPWSQTDPLRREVVNQNGIALQVVAREKSGLTANGSYVKRAVVAQHVHDHLRAAAVALVSTSVSVFLCRPGGDFVLEVQVDPAAERDCVLLDEAQRLSLRVCDGEVYEWVPFDPTKAEPLAEVAIEAQLLDPLPDGHPPIDLDCGSFGKLLSKLMFGSIVSDNELIIVPHDGAQLALRVSGVVSMAQAAAAEAEEALHAAGGTVGEGGAAAMVGTQGEPTALDEADAAIDSHCFRGSIVPTTFFRVLPSSTYVGSNSQRAVVQGLHLIGWEKRKERLRHNLVEIHTSDGEMFPVSRRLLRPCIALTEAVRSEEVRPSVMVPIDCLTFDRILLFLEAAAVGTSRDFNFDVATLDDMDEAAKWLGYRLLQECVARKKGDFKSRITMHKWEDIVRQNEAGACYVTMDGMVLDLKAWLPQHPGGATIIPQQGLNRDCTVFFELYHASRESFMYLREFYVGELWPSELSKVPHHDERASDDFMAQLRDFSSAFRINAPTFEASAMKAKVHLGA